MRKTIVTFALISVFLSGCSNSDQYRSEENIPAETPLMPTTATEMTYPAFEPIEGYDALQTVFLAFDKDTTYDEVISTLNAAGLYYSDTKILKSWYFEIAYNEPVKSIYGTKLYDTDSIELTLTETDDGVFLVESTTYYFLGKGVQSVYEFNRGYSTSDLANAVEEFVFVDTNMKIAYGFAHVDGATREEILNLGIVYEKNEETIEAGE